MSNEEERKIQDKLEAGRIKWELNEIRDELMDELEDLQDDFKDEIEELREASEDIKDDLKEELEEIKEEERSLMNEIRDVKDELENLGDNAKDKFEHTQKKLEHIREKIRRHESKYGARIKKLLEKAKRKSVKRINISVDAEMSDEWKDWAGDLGASVSELVRKSMKFVKNNIGDIAKLEEWGRKMENLGEGIEKSVKESGIENLGESIEKEIKFQVGKTGIKQKIKININGESDKKRIKKRVHGLIKLYKSLPIDKLAKALNRTNEYAENLIYELAAEGIDGSLEDEVFKFTNTSEEVISKLSDLIDKMI